MGNQFERFDTKEAMPTVPSNLGRFRFTVADDGRYWYRFDSREGQQTTTIRGTGWGSSWGDAIKRAFGDPSFKDGPFLDAVAHVFGRQSDVMRIAIEITARHRSVFPVIQED